MILEGCFFQIDKNKLSMYKSNYRAINPAYKPFLTSQRLINPAYKLFFCLSVGVLRQKHSIFDEETCCKVEVQEPLAVALLEARAQPGHSQGAMVS